MLAPGSVPVALAQDGLEARLRARYEGQVVTLRGFPAGNRLRYDAAGAPIERRAPGIWTLDGRVRIDRIRLSRTALRIDGSRLGISYDPQRGAVHVLLRGRGVRVDVAVGASGGEQRVEAAIGRVFLTSRDDLAELVPPFWQRFLRGYRSPLEPPSIDEARTLDAPQRPVPVPRRVQFVRPAYPRVAQEFRRTGIVAFEAVLTIEGTIAELHVIQPAGFGLDEAAAEAIGQWAFEPVVVDGTPVPAIVRLSAEFLPTR